MIENFYQTKPDVVLLDIRMPVMDGHEAALILLQRYPDVKIIAWTLFEEPEEVISMYKIGVRSFIGKKEADIYNAIKIVASGASEFLASLKIPASKEYVQKLIKAHPDYPSLLSVSDIFRRLGIDHVVHRVRKEELIDISYPYLLPLDQGRGDLLLIRSEKDLEKNKDRLQQWSGIVLQAESTNHVRDKSAHEIFETERKIRFSLIILACAVTGAVCSLLVGSFTWNIFLLIVTSVFGVLTGYILMAKELGISFKAVDEFCNAGKNTNCDRVLKGDVQFFGIPFSDAVAIYFVFQFAVLVGSILMPQVRSTVTPALAVVGLIAMPVVVYSLYYQKFIAKTWCRLCLIVSALLIFQCLLFLATLPFADTADWLSLPLIISVVAILLISGSAVTLIKTIAIKSKKLSSVGGEANRIKHSVEVFNHFLQKQKRVDMTPFENEMILGNPNAPVKIIMVSNLFCKPCKEKHKVVEELVEIYPDEVCVCLRFVRSGSETNAVRHLLNYWLCQIAAKQDTLTKTLKLMEEWFDVWNFAKFKLAHPISEQNDPKATRLEGQHYEWIRRHEVNLTPTFFINGYQLPKEYTIIDLLFLVASMSEQIKINEAVKTA